MTTISEYKEWLNDNRDRILLTSAIGEDLVNKLSDANVKYTVNEDGSVEFFDCPAQLLQEIKDAKNKKS